MRFEHILQVYWSKGFFFGGKLFYSNKLTFSNLFQLHLYGLRYKFKQILIKRFELTTFTKYYSHLMFLTNYFTTHFKNLTKTTNIIFSQINNVNLSVNGLEKLNIIRTYLTKSYRGYCHAIGKPVRGQRTWSNSWNSFKCNYVLRNFITKTKQIKALREKNTLLKVDYKSVKKKYTIVSKNMKNTNQSPYKTTTLMGTKSWY
jgi:hypothetical protein